MSERPRYQLYGRRTGRRVRPAAARLLEDLLPRLRIELPREGTLKPSLLFKEAKSEYWLEIGFGSGEHLVNQAESHPGVGFLGAEPFRSGVAKLLTSISERKLENIRIFDDDARLLFAPMESRSLERVFILFPDPWPKSRHAKRRIVNASTLRELHRAMKPGGELRIATDSPGLIRWILVHVCRHGGFLWLARSPRDWRERPVNWKATRYEAKALKSGRVPSYLTFRRLTLE